MYLEAEATGDDALAVIKKHLQSAEGDATARESLKRHYEHLESLARNLRKLGMDEREIDTSIMLVFREYEQELENYLRTLGGGEEQSLGLTEER